MSLFTNGNEIVGAGITPSIGPNGNWFIGEHDTGVPTGTEIHYNTKEEFNNQFEEGIYFVYEPPATITIYHINEDGYKRVVTDKQVIVPVKGDNGNWFIGTTDTGIPVSGDGATIAGATINDNTTDGTTTWSSTKISKVIQDIVRNITGKSVEITWQGTKLGTRIEGDEKFNFVDLKGEKGDTGLNGASIVSAKMNDAGELVLEVPDNFDNRDLSKILTFESGVITLNDMITITENITRLQNKVQELTEKVEELTNSSNG